LSHATCIFRPVEKTWEDYHSEGSEPESEVESVSSQTSVLDELHEVLDSLYSLLPALVSVLKSGDFSIPAPVEPQSITGYYEHMIRDKFCAAPEYLILRFATVTQRTRELIQSGSQIDCNDTSPLPGGHSTVVGSHLSNPVTEISMLQTHLISTATGSETPSSQGEILARLPPMPENAGRCFDCPICLRQQQPIFNARQWR